MSGRCCHPARQKGGAEGFAGSRCRLRGVAGWIVPGATLALLPKCPACMAAYIAVATGLGVSLSTAQWLRLSIIVSSIAWLAVLTVRYFAPRIRRAGQV